ncbi:645e2849-f50d-4257-9e17-de5943f27033 [Thermothielavioides terrestris]|uniref:645e2849-f50d-4257-9e17-de5943f27033 n=1 Tax=Thermothielavioides terrestris TaxID=2587410 RepID=A0A3S4B7I6_9PEZI|nr:645e2849-f50d-4257-9e17-de5943f27033 [Thermothielavioides terrestris]
MDPHSAAQAGGDDYDPFLQHVEQSPRWDPLAATPDVDLPASPPQPPRVAFASGGPYPPTGADTPSSSVGLGIESADQARFPGYHAIVSRDSFQQDSAPGTPSAPQPANEPSKSTFQTFQRQEYTLGSPDTAPYYGYYPHPHGDAVSPNGPRGPRWARLTRSRAWMMLSGGWPMYVTFLLGFGFAVGHHGFYSRLDGKPADDQIRMMRFGNLLSYAAKASFVATVMFSYRQQVWVTAIRNVLRLRTIDGLFAALEEPVALFNWEFLKKAPVNFSLAVLAWLFPLVVILIPAALTVAPLTETVDGQCFGVRTLNFDAEKSKNWRTTDRINGYRSISLSYYNSTVSNSDNMVDTPFNDTFFDYWTGISNQLDLVSARSVLSGAVIPRRDVALETCGAGWNCSYTISFQAPGYKCDEKARNQSLDADILGLPFDRSLLSPVGNYSYVAKTMLGEYYSPQVDVQIGGVPKSKPPYPHNLGAFRTEPELWIGYVEYKGPGRPPDNRSSEDWNTSLEAVIFRCDHYLTNYTVQFNHTYSQQATTVLKRDYLRPIINTTYIPDKNANDGTHDNTTAVPESNFVFPIDYENYRVTAAYHSLGLTMRRYLDGNVQYVPFAMIAGDLAKTALLDTESYLPVPGLMEQVQLLYENITLSLLSYPQFVVVAWAALPANRSGVSNSTDPALAYPCVRTRVANAYVFNRRDLWLFYAIAIALAFAAVVLGTAALGQNDFHVRDTHVSSVVAATRAPCLDGLPWKASKWGEVPREILDTPLGYGIVAEPGPNGTPAATAMAGALGSPVVVSGKVYYGFAPKEVPERTRVATFGPGHHQRRSRFSAWSFKPWHRDEGGQGL